MKIDVLILLSGLLAALLAHEAGHFSAARALGYRPKLVWRKLGPGTAWGNDRVPTTARVLVSSAGPFASLVFAAVSHSAGFEMAALASLELAVLNLIPFPHSDGRKIVAALARR